MGVMLLGAVCPTLGAPFFGEPRTFRQPDGSEVTLILHGDEYYMRAETEEGYTVVRDPETGWICYAALSADGRELISTGVEYRQADSEPTLTSAGTLQSLSLPLHLDLRPGDRVRQSGLNKAALLGGHLEVIESAPELRGDSRTSTGASASPAAQPDPVTSDAEGDLPPRKSDLAKYSGTVRGMVLVFDFSDAPAPGSPSFLEIVNSVNQPNLHKPNGRPNSLRTFFEEVSEGTFIVSNFVFGVYRATNTFAHYDSIGYGVGAQALMGQALQQVEAGGFDFSQLSVDGNNEVESLCVMYTGNPQTWAEGMWYHAGWWGSGPTYDGVTFRQYCTTTYSADPGTLIHENGHMIADWPDLYSYNGAATGTWDVMGGGWTDLPNPYLLYQNGWLDVINVQGIYGLRAMSALDPHNALVFYDPAQPDEFYFIRPYTRNLLYCADIPDEGLALWRINRQGANADYPERPLEMELLHANGVVANASENVLFKAAGRNRYTDVSVPGSRWAYHGRTGQRSGMHLTGISAPGGAMSFRVSRPIYFYPVDTQVSALGTPTSLKVTATADTSVFYAASGLPPGLSINPSTGLISGTPNTVGGYKVTLTANGTEGSQNVCEFAWLVGSGTATAPAAWYPLNGNLADASGNGGHGTPLGAVSFVNNTLQFNGSNTAVNIPRLVSDDFTIAFFMKASAAGSSGNQWYQGAGLVDGEVAGATHDFGVSLTGEQVAFGVGAPGNDVTIQSLRKVADGQWHHVAVTRNAASGAMALYIDGTLDASGTGSTGAKTAPPALRLGSLQTGINYFHGALDEVRIYASVVPAEEIHRLSTGRCVVLPVEDQVSAVGEAVNLSIWATNATNLTYTAIGLPTGLSIHPLTGVISGWPSVPGIFDVTIKAGSTQGPEGTVQFAWGVSSSATVGAPVAWYPLAVDANDVSGFNRHGLVLGSPSHPFLGIQLDGIDDAIQIPRSILADFTISFFINVSASVNDGSQWYHGAGLVDGEVAGATHDFGVSLTGDRVAFGVGSPGGDTTIKSDTPVTDRLWHHVAVTRSSASGAVAIYVDGRLDKTGNGPTGAKGAPPVLRIGSLQTAINYFNGGIAEVQLYDQVLSAGEIFLQSRLIPSDPGYRIRDTQWSFPDSVGLTWNTTPGEIYQVEWAVGLGQSFAPLGAPVPAGTAVNATRRVSLPGTNGFYRIRKL